MARGRVLLENEEKRERGPKVGYNKNYKKVQKRIASRLFLALGTEGKKRFVPKSPYMEASKLKSQREILAKASFEKTQSFTYERYKLFNRSQETRKTMEFFLATLTAQAARAELGILKDELVRDPFMKRWKTWK